MQLACVLARRIAWAMIALNVCLYIYRYTDIYASFTRIDFYAYKDTWRQSITLISPASCQRFHPYCISCSARSCLACMPGHFPNAHNICRTWSLLLCSTLLTREWWCIDIYIYFSFSSYHSYILCDAFSRAMYNLWPSLHYVRCQRLYELRGFSIEFCQTKWPAVLWSTHADRRNQSRVFICRCLWQPIATRVWWSGTGLYRVRSNDRYITIIIIIITIIDIAIDSFHGSSRNHTISRKARQQSLRLLSLKNVFKDFPWMHPGSVVRAHRAIVYVNIAAQYPLRHQHTVSRRIRPFFLFKSFARVEAMHPLTCHTKYDRERDIMCNSSTGSWLDISIYRSIYRSIAREAYIPIVTLFFVAVPSHDNRCRCIRDCLLYVIATIEIPTWCHWIDILRDDSW